MRLRRLEPVLRRAMQGPCALPAGSRVLVAVSGGADSTALLLGLVPIAGELGLGLHAAHLHHGLRGAEADRDRAFVRALCARAGVPLTDRRVDARARMRREGLTGEAGLRVLRRRFLAAVARREGAAAIATAHTADDQLETVLMRLARGTGPAGLAGMRARHGRWLKPLLGSTRAEIVAELERAGQGWREDASNRERRWARNRVRLDVVPALAAAMWPGLPPGRSRSILARNASRAGAGAASVVRFVASLAADELREVGSIQAGAFALASSRVAPYPPAVRHMVLRRLWKRLAPASPGLTHRNLDGLDRLLGRTRGGAVVELPGGWQAERDRSAIRFRRKHPAAEFPRRPLAVPGRIENERGVVRGRWLAGDRARVRLPRCGPTEAFFAAGGLRGALELRAAGPEEWFEPFGAPRRVPLGRFLSRQPIAREWKRSPVVLSDAGGILWVVGVRRASRAPVTPRTRRVLHVALERHD